MAGENKSQLTRIEDGLFGNGHEGLLSRTARIEENLEAVSEAIAETEKSAQETSQVSEASFKNLYDLMTGISAIVDRLATSVEEHHKTEHLSDIVKANPVLKVITESMKDPHFARNVVIFGVVSFVVLHLVSTYIPNVWDWIMTILGLPHFIVPLG